MKTESSDSEEVFRYTYLPEGIHELVFFAATQAALDQCFARLDIIFADTPIDQPILLISDIRQAGVPPVGPLVSYARRLFRKYNRHTIICDAVIHRQEGRLYNTFLLVMEQLARLYRAKVRFYRGDEYPKAIHWLLQNRHKNGKS